MSKKLRRQLLIAGTIVLFILANFGANKILGSVFENDLGVENIQKNTEILEKNHITNKAFVGVKVPDLFACGSIISKDGDDYYVLANWHVADNDTKGGKTTLVTYDGSEHKGTLVQHDYARDLALIKFTSKEKYATYKIATNAAPGENVFVVGIPWNFQNFGKTFEGPLSTTDLQPVLGDQRYIELWSVGTQSYEGNSGGPTLNSKGEIVGIVQGYIDSNKNPLIIKYTTINNFVKAHKINLVDSSTIKTEKKRNLTTYYVTYAITELIIIGIFAGWALYMHKNLLEKRFKK